jgi:SAM-dependent methyltransferase
MPEKDPSHHEPTKAESASGNQYYGHDLALVHHLGFGFHADACAPGILRLLEPIRERGGLVLEVGCGSGLLTRHLVDAGHRVIATDASPAMVELAVEYATGAEDVRVLVLPDDPLPEADAVVSVGHVVNYVGERDAVERAIVAIARAVRPGGLFAIDVCDLEWAALRQGAPGAGRIGDDWAVAVEFSIPAPDRFVRHIVTFLRNDDGTWRRSDERHENVLLDTTRIPDLLAPEGVDVTIGTSFGAETLPAGLRTVIARRPPL